MKLRSLLLLASFALLTGCEAPYVGEPVAEEEEDANMVLCVTGVQMIPFEEGVSAPMKAPATRAQQPITELCSRLTFVVYQGETKFRSVVQKRGDKGFGTVAFSLPQGNYTFAIIGYNSDGACTVTSLDKISFKDNRVTDTFLYCEDLEVTDTKTTHEVELTRVVAMFRLVLTDNEIPAEVRQLKFYYTGGSSTLSALTSYGSVNSKQTVKLDVSTGVKTYEVYTIPHDETGSLKMTVTALDANDNTIKEHIFEALPVRRNTITVYTGNFFDGSTESGDIGFGMTAESEWEEGPNATF